MDIKILDLVAEIMRAAVEVKGVSVSYNGFYNLDVQFINSDKGGTYILFVENDDISRLAVILMQCLAEINKLKGE